VIGICRELGLGLRIAPSDGPRRGGLVSHPGGRREVVVFRDHPAPPRLAPHERFTVAHELGHHVLLEESGFEARRRRDYWLGEELCQAFAAELLLPERLLAAIGEPRGPDDLMGAVNRLARLAGVSAEPAARAVVARSGAPIALGTFLLAPNQRTGRLGFRGWWIENRQWWGARGGRRLAVYADHPLAPVLRAMRSMRHGQSAPLELAGAADATLRRRRGSGASFAAALS
jgi:hypothetical protein